MFILKGLKVLCFDTLLQVFILKVDIGTVGAIAELLALSILLRVHFLGNAGGKGVRWLAGYFMGYYTIWLAPVKSKIVPFWELGKRADASEQMKAAALEPKAAAPAYPSCQQGS